MFLCWLKKNVKKEIRRKLKYFLYEDSERTEVYFEGKTIFAIDFFTGSGFEIYPAAKEIISESILFDSEIFFKVAGFVIEKRKNIE